MKSVFLVGDVVNGIFTQELESYPQAWEEYSYAVEEGAGAEFDSGESGASYANFLEKSQAFHFIMRREYKADGSYSETVIDGGTFSV